MRDFLSLIAYSLIVLVALLVANALLVNLTEALRDL